eukprot:scaffold3188_cov68-Phaeocystis_antarctica.AAC.6
MRTRPSGAARVVSAKTRSGPSRPSYGVLANDAVRGSRAAIKTNRMTSGGVACEVWVACPVAELQTQTKGD